MIKYIKSVLWIVAKCLSYTEEARCLKVNISNTNDDNATKFEQEYVRCVSELLHNEVSPLQISLQYPH